MPVATKRRWGDNRAIVNDEQARQRLIEAATRCIVRRGDAQFRMVEVAEEAGVARSTVYRYFPSRDELILSLLLSRMDAALDEVVRNLPDPDDATRSIPDLILEPIGLVEGNPLNEALFSPASSASVTWLELTAEPLVDAVFRQYGPLMERWQAVGQLHQDLDLREAVRWINAISLILLSPPWRERPRRQKRHFLEQYLVRAMVPGRPSSPHDSDERSRLSQDRTYH